MLIQSPGQGTAIRLALNTKALQVNLKPFLTTFGVTALSVIDAVNFTIAALILIIFAPLRNKVGKFESTIMIVLLLIYYGFILWEGLGL